TLSAEQSWRFSCTSVAPTAWHTAHLIDEGCPLRVAREPHAPDSGRAKRGYSVKRGTGDYNKRFFRVSRRDARAGLPRSTRSQWAPAAATPPHPPPRGHAGRHLQ